MTDRLAIWNIALGRISEGQTVDDPDEDTVGGRACRRHYDLARDAVLAEFSWGFARRTVRLAALASPPETGWSCLYAYPADALAIHRIGPLRQSMAGYGETLHTIRPTVWATPWETMGITNELGDDIRAIGSNIAEAFAFYTRRVIDETLYPPLFADALAWRLATDLAMVIPRDDVMRKTAWDGYNAVLERARSMAAREAVEILPDSELILARA